jgi:hypothetical protein
VREALPVSVHPGCLEPPPAFQIGSEKLNAW